MKNAGQYAAGWPQTLIYCSFFNRFAMPDGSTAGSGTWDDAFRPVMTKLFKCPATESDYYGDLRTGSYAINNDIWAQGPPPLKLPIYIKNTQIKVPASFILLAENQDPIVSGKVTISRPDISNPKGFNRRHSEGGNFEYADGHVEWHPSMEWVKKMQAWSVTAWPFYAPNIRLPFKNSDY
jgi:prepilin-type processing-associated H-X9-DG protein